MTKERSFYLREWREARGLTQEQLAEHAAMSASHLANVERGTKRYNEDILKALATALGCEPWELIGRNPNQRAAAVVQIWDRIASGKRDQARRTLESFAEPKKEA